MKQELELILNSDMSLEEKVKAIVKLKKFPTSGMASCLHHDTLFEYCTSFENRTRVILETKNPHEHLIRFLNFTFIPDEFLPAEVTEAAVGLDETYARWKEAKARLDEAYVRWDEAIARWKEAKAQWPYVEKLVLLNKLAPENTWNGNNIGWKYKK